MKTQITPRNVSRTLFNPEIWCLVMAIAFAFAAGMAHGQTDNVLKIKIAKGSYSDETIIRYLPEATNSFDESYDAWKLFSYNTAVPNIYTKDSLANKVAINSMPSFNASVVVDVYVKIGTAGTYSISASELGVFGSGVKIMMKDLATSQYYNLRTASVYTFSLPVTGTSAGPRFRVLFSYPSSIQVESSTCLDCTDGGLIVTKPGETAWNYTVRDAAGNNVSTGSAASNSAEINGLIAGNYTVTITNNFNCTETRLFAIESSPGVLGATFAGFNAVREGKNIKIEWATSMESNTDYFSLQRSKDGVDFETIKETQAAGQSSGLLSYSSLDEAPYEGTCYYRIKLTDNNGDISFTHVASVSGITSGALSVFPIPVVDQMNICLEGNTGSEVLIVIKDMAGRLVFSEKVTPSSDHEIHTIRISPVFVPGTYSIAAFGKENWSQQKLIIK